jgi:16S rRNA (uracil1498-N3)-methyltransferase
VASIQPLITERSVLRLAGERADKKQAHWQSIAIAACEQCGRNRVPVVQAVMGLAQWSKTLSPPQGHDMRYLLSLRAGSQALVRVLADLPGRNESFSFLSGPEGGLSEAEELAALAHGFTAVTLGPRVLRAETAALAALTLLS